MFLLIGISLLLIFLKCIEKIIIQAFVKSISKRVINNLTIKEK